MRGWNKGHALSVGRAYGKITAIRKRIIEEAKKRPCADCYGWFNSWQMQFDHVKGDKRFNIGGSYTRSIKDLVNEMSKCEVVCANCHADRTYKQGRKAQKEN